MAGSEYAAALIQGVLERQEALAEEDSEMAEEEDTRQEDSDETKEKQKRIVTGRRTTAPQSTQVKMLAG